MKKLNNTSNVKFLNEKNPEIKKTLRQYLQYALDNIDDDELETTIDSVAIVVTYSDNTYNYHYTKHGKCTDLVYCLEALKHVIVEQQEY